MVRTWKTRGGKYGLTFNTETLRVSETTNGLETAVYQSLRSKDEALTHALKIVRDRKRYDNITLKEVTE